MVSKTNSNFGIENSAENRQEVKDKLIQTFLQNAVNEVGRFTLTPDGLIWI